MTLISCADLLGMHRRLDGDWDKEKFTCSPENVKQILFKVVMPQGNAVWVTAQKGEARRIAAAACGQVVEVESELDMGAIPEPCRWCEDDKDFW